MRSKLSFCFIEESFAEICDRKLEQVDSSVLGCLSGDIFCVASYGYDFEFSSETAQILEEFVGGSGRKIYSCGKIYFCFAADVFELADLFSGGVGG